MVISMTGFGKGEAASKDKRAECDMRAVNHRFLDVSIKIPKEYIFLESKIKEVVGKFVARGKIDCFFLVELFESSKVKVHVDSELARQYAKAFNKLTKEIGTNENVSAEYISTLPGVVHVSEGKKDLSGISELILLATERAVKKLLAMRKVEGKALKNDIKGRCKALKKFVGKLKKTTPVVHKALREKVVAKISEIENETSFSIERIEQEIAFHMMKMDVSEELTRLDSHIDQINNVIDDGKVIGRKLDFLLQEANREITTCGNKIQGLEISTVVVDIKSELEKIREQVQNVE